MGPIFFHPWQELHLSAWKSLGNGPERPKIRISCELVGCPNRRTLKFMGLFVFVCLQICNQFWMIFEVIFRDINITWWLAARLLYQQEGNNTNPLFLKVNEHDLLQNLGEARWGTGPLAAQHWHVHTKQLDPLKLCDSDCPVVNWRIPPPKA